jgi:hypothetical protein
MHRNLIHVFVAGLVVLLSGCAFTPSAHPTSGPTNAATTAVQDITLTGRLPDRWTTAEVQCSGGGSDSLTVTLTGGGDRKSTLTINIASGYDGPGEYSETLGPNGKPDELSVALQAEGDNEPLAVSTSALPAIVTVLRDKDRDKTAPQTMGQIEARLGMQANPVDPIEFVSGTWRCAP